ncbi:MAG: PqqD family protein [Nitrospirae bacterium]|nr:PqqD family protein [Nitrospirota bacterium]
MNSAPGSNKKVFIKKKEIVARKIAGEIILVPIAGKLAGMQQIFTLNAAGQYIWDHLDGAENLGEIIAGVQSFFDVDTKQAEADVMDFIDELLVNELITKTN